MPISRRWATVTADLLKRMGMDVDLRDSDWGTVVQRRASREPVDKGGWSIFHTTGPAVGLADPAMSYVVRGQGATGWTGWWDNPQAEQLTQAWLNARDPAEQRAAAAALGTLALAQAGTIPLGQFIGHTGASGRDHGCAAGAAFLSRGTFARRELRLQRDLLKGSALHPEGDGPSPSPLLSGWGGAKA